MLRSFSDRRFTVWILTVGNARAVPIILTRHNLSAWSARSDMYAQVETRFPSFALQVCNFSPASHRIFSAGVLECIFSLIFIVHSQYRWGFPDSCGSLLLNASAYVGKVTSTCTTNRKRLWCLSTDNSAAVSCVSKFCFCHASRELLRRICLFGASSLSPEPSLSEVSLLSRRDYDANAELRVIWEWDCPSTLSW